MLEESDFETNDPNFHVDILGLQKREHVLYAIEMAKLARLCKLYYLTGVLTVRSNRFAVGKIILREFSPRSELRKDSERSKLSEELTRWESDLVPAMRSNATPDSFWAAMLHTAYK